MNKATIATGGAFGASLLSALATSCCLAPALVVAFGVSASLATPLTYLEPYRRYLTAVGALCLGLAAWWLYRRPAPGTCIPPSQRQTRLFFWLSVASLLSTTIYSYVVID